jgi:hypothetical protein
MQSRKDKVLKIASLATLTSALVLLALVIERLMAAAWQWYKFSGYSNDGHISLSLRTGLVFSCVLVVVFAGAVCLHRLAKRCSATHAVAYSRWAIYIVMVVIFSYWLLGMSSFNVWRA